MLRDLRYAARVLLRSPGYALVVIAVLAIGIGTNLVAFGSYKALALTPVAGVTDSADLQVVAATTTAGRRWRCRIRTANFCAIASTFTAALRGPTSVASSSAQAWRPGPAGIR